MADQAIGSAGRTASLRALTDEEYRCLREVASLADSGGGCCSPELLLRLQELGLIEEAVIQWLPLEMPGRKWVLTLSGRGQLDEALK